MLVGRSYGRIVFRGKNIHFASPSVHAYQIEMDGRIPKKRRVLAELSESPVKNPATAAPRSNSASSPSIMEEFRPKKAAKKNSNSSSSNGKHADGPKRGQSKNRGKKKKAPEPPKGDKDALCGVDLSDKSVTAPTQWRFCGGPEKTV